MAVITLQVPAGQATAGPPVGPTLGQYGINIPQFIKQYNEQTASQIGMVIPAELTIFGDRSFTFKLKTPPASDLIRKAAGVGKGSNEPHRTKVGQLTQAQLREIAETKMPDLNALNVEGAMKIIAGTARSMGVDIV
jgi:large subunit ribosomal protein L11